MLAYAQAAHALEAALLLDTARGDVRARLAAVTFERIQLAERDHRPDERAELVSRLAVYDDGTVARRLAAPGQVINAIAPPEATAVLERDAAPTEPLPAGTTELYPGDYRVVARAPGRVTVRAALRVRAGEAQQLAFELPRLLPAGFAYIPAGAFLYGSGEGERVRAFFGTAPMHERRTDAFLIGDHRGHLRAVD